MTKFRVALALFTALLLSACYPPTTSHPLGGTAATTPDPALLGVWKGAPRSAGERGVYFHFLGRLDGTITAIMVQTGNQPDGDYAVFKLTTVKLGANRFMNATPLSSDGKPDDGLHGTVPVLYRIDAKGALTLCLMDEAATKAAIRAGKIKGTIGQGDDGDAVITADPAALDKFMQSPAALALFAKPSTTLKKVE
jgi:hypothetical protein